MASPDFGSDKSYVSYPLDKSKSLSEESESLPSSAGQLRYHKRKKSNSSSSCRTKRTKTHQRPTLEVIKPTDFVCLYEQNHDHLPAYIKRGEQNSKVLRCCQFTRKAHTQLKPLLSLTRSQEEYKECIFACAEVMFEGLTLKEGSWEDNSSSVHERLQKSVHLENNFHEGCSISQSLLRFYDSMTEGFGYGTARNGLQNIFMMCKDIFSKKGGAVPVVIVVDNVGGASRKGFDGNVGIAKQIYQLNKDITEEERRSQAIGVLHNEKAEITGSVPDVTMCKRCSNKKSYFMFAACKVMENQLEIKDVDFSQVWHQALRGLFDQDHVYGCVVNGTQGALFKMEVTDDMLETAYTEFDFYLSAFGDVRFFSIGSFKLFLDFVISIIQEKVKEN